MLSSMVIVPGLVRGFLEILLVVLFQKLILFVIWILRLLLIDFILLGDFLIIFLILFDLFLGSLGFEDIYA
jgi:hypothetical protein